MRQADHQVDRQGAFQTLSRFHLPLFYLAAALEHLVNDFDLPALGIPADSLNGLERPR